MPSNPMRGMGVPLFLYGVTALTCWFMPFRLSLDRDFELVLNVYPTKALAIATISLGIAHTSLRLQGALAVAVAASWAVATMMLATTFAVSPHVAPSTWSAIMVFQTLALGASAVAVFALAWQLAWRRLTADLQWVARAPLVLGVSLLAYNYAALALREVGVLIAPRGLEEMAELSAALTVDLWISSAFLLVGATSHRVFPRRAWERT